MDNFGYIDMNYTDFLNIRRSDSCKIIYEDNSLFYKLFMTDKDGHKLTCAVEKNTENGSDFEQNRKMFCNKSTDPNSVDVKTHDYSDSSTWRYGHGNSIYIIKPLSRKVLIPVRFKSIFDKGMIINNGQEFKVALWQTIDGVTTIPESSDTSTAIIAGTSQTEFVVSNPAGFSENDRVKITLNGESKYSIIAGISGNNVTLDSTVSLPSIPQNGDVMYLWNPTKYGGDGWIQLYPSLDDNQLVKVLAYFSGGIPLYKVSVFTYASLSDIGIQSDVSDEGSERHVFFKYKENSERFSLISSLNERMEFWIQNHSPYNRPNSVGAFMSALWSSYDEW